jgi:hypothetical protein
MRGKGVDTGMFRGLSWSIVEGVMGAVAIGLVSRVLATTQCEHAGVGDFHFQRLKLTTLVRAIAEWLVV